MKKKLLAIDKDSHKFTTYQEAWLKVGVSSIRVLSMQEAIELLAREIFMVVHINADTINYMSMLPIVRELTKAHISVSTSKFTIQENIQALKNGTDFFSEWWHNLDESVERGVVMMEKAMEERKTTRRNVEFISYKDIVIHLNSRNVYIDDEKIDMTTQDYNLLTFLIENPKQVYSYDQILEHVWKFDENNNDKNTLRSAISRLRKKLKGKCKTQEYIVSRYDYGYSFDK